VTRSLRFGLICRVTAMNRCYSELVLLPSFSERFEYLKLGGTVGRSTFGYDRWLNQILYHDEAWKKCRREILIRDNFCDLGHPEHEMTNRMLVHHMNPITKQDILDRSSKLFDPENLITVSFLTHEAIHYGDAGLLPKGPVVRMPNDTCPWR